MLSQWSTRLPRPSRPASHHWPSCAHPCWNAARSSRMRCSPPRTCRSRACARAASRRLEALERSLRDPHRAPSPRSCWSGRSRAASRRAQLRRARRCLAARLRRARARRWPGAPRGSEALLGAAGGVLERVSTAARPSSTPRIARRCAGAPRSPTACAPPRACWPASRSISIGCSMRSARDRRGPRLRLGRRRGARAGRAARDRRQHGSRRGWVQRWHLRADGGFAARALTNEGAAIASDPPTSPSRATAAQRGARLRPARRRAGERGRRVLRSRRR